MIPASRKIIIITIKGAMNFSIKYQRGTNHLRSHPSKNSFFKSFFMMNQPMKIAVNKPESGMSQFDVI